jgi:RNA polymerase sigma-70 factor (ECF subfamily)
MEPGSEPAIVAGLRRGDPKAFDAAYARYRGRLYGFLVRLTRRPFLAEDLLQETWLSLARHALTLRADTNLGAWLFTVARNRYRSYRRWALLDADRLREVGLWPRATGSPFDDAAADETERRLEALLGSLPLKYREAVLLVGVEGLAPEQAAEVLGVSPEALRQRLSRGRAMLRERLGAPSAAVAVCGGAR